MFEVSQLAPKHPFHYGKKRGGAVQGFSRRLTLFLFLFFVRLLENSRTLEGHDPKENHFHSAGNKYGKAGIFAANHFFFHPPSFPLSFPLLGLLPWSLCFLRRQRFEFELKSMEPGRGDGEAKKRSFLGKKNRIFICDEKN